MCNVDYRNKVASEGKVGDFVLYQASDKGWYSGRVDRADGEPRTLMIRSTDKRNIGSIGYIDRNVPSFLVSSTFLEGRLTRDERIAQLSTHSNPMRPEILNGALRGLDAVVANYRP